MFEFDFVERRYSKLSVEFRKERIVLVLFIGTTASCNDNHDNIRHRFQREEVFHVLFFCKATILLNIKTPDN
ncbi:hypothetical protein DSECCO2_542890 [anaerobic digester metagenome]